MSTAFAPSCGDRRLVLTVTCPDSTGIVAAVTGFIAEHGGSVVEAAQHGDLQTGCFFQRIEILAESLPFGPDEFAGRFTDVANRARAGLEAARHPRAPRVVILVSKEDHCLADLLHQWRSGDLQARHPAGHFQSPRPPPLVDWHGIEFRHIPFRGRPQGRGVRRARFALFDGRLRAT